MKIKDSSKLNLNSKKNRQGFMLVDGLVAVLIVAIGLVSLAFMYTHGIKARVAGERRQAAVQIAGQEMERLKKYDGGTYKALKDNVYDETSEYITPTVTGLGDYQISSEIVDAKEIDEVDAKNATQKIETVQVKVSWNDPVENQIIIEGYILVNK